jgi:uncharacterized protein
MHTLSHSNIKTGHSALLVLAALAIATASKAHAMPSDTLFDCDDARIVTERTLCARPSLKRMDDSISIAYHVKMAGLASPVLSSRVKAHLRSSQRAHLVRRDSCGANVRCIEAVLIARQSQIEEYR